MPHQPDPEHHDLIDEAALPRFDLSMSALLAIFIGGGLGTVARYLMAHAFAATPGQFPSVTLVINLSGSMLIGLLIPLTEHLNDRLPHARPFLAIGLLGGWTTYSTLAIDAIQLAQHGRFASMVGYLAATVLGGIALVIAGNVIGHRVVPP